MSAAPPSEPLVGEIRAVRTFRLGAGGRLYPLFDDTAWSADVTTARCRVAPDAVDHAVPDPDCTCGLYAFASPDVAAQYPHAAHVLGVVAVWGGVVVGTRGVRAQHGRVEALWLSPTVPRTLVAQAAAAYPSTALFDDRDAMLRAHPPSVLPDHEPPVRGLGRRHRLAGAVALSALVVLGIVGGAVGSGAGAAVAALAMLTGAVEVAALGAWQVHRTRRSAATFPAPVGPSRGHRSRRRAS